MKITLLFWLTVLLTGSFACNEFESPEPPGMEINMAAGNFIFAVIGDYGYAGENEASVAAMVKGWDPDFVLTTGDNNYPGGDLESIKANISDYYGDYIYNFDAEKDYRCQGRAFDDQINRFFPTPGNHDTYGINGLKPYLGFFALPGNEEYYAFTWGDVAFYSLNSTASFIGNQEEWLKDELAKRDKPFNIVFFHHSPFSTGKHGNERKMQLDYHGLGIDIVFTGHDHIYSRIGKKDEDALYYIVNGAGGRSLYQCGANELDTSQFSVLCFDEDFGAIRGEYKDNQLIIEFYSVGDQQNPVDSFVVPRRE